MTVIVPPTARWGRSVAVQVPAPRAPNEFQHDHRRRPSAQRCPRGHGLRFLFPHALPFVAHSHFDIVLTRMPLGQRRQRSRRQQRWRQCPSQRSSCVRNLAAASLLLRVRKVLKHLHGPVSAKIRPMAISSIESPAEGGERPQPGNRKAVMANITVLTNTFRQRQHHLLRLRIKTLSRSVHLHGHALVDRRQWANAWQAYACQPNPRATLCTAACRQSVNRVST